MKPTTKIILTTLAVVSGLILLGYLLKLKPKAHKLLFVGDSNTKANFSYVDQLKKKYPNSIIKKIAENGKDTAWLLGQLKSELKANKYDTVSVLGGSNDIMGGKPLSTIIGNLKEMNELIHQNGAKSVLISPPNKDFFPKATSEQKNKLLALVSWEKEHSKFDTFIDFNKITQDKTLFSKTDDYLHPQTKAHKLLAEDFESKIKLV